VNTVLDGSYRIMRVVGSGGFGITYEAEDLNLGTTVALKEYYPDEFGDRDARMSVRAKSERHKQTFEWGRSNFLKEARTLARFEHPSIVRVTRVFEANSTAYMVMIFELGQTLGPYDFIRRCTRHEHRLENVLGDRAADRPPLDVRNQLGEPRRHDHRLKAGEIKTLFVQLRADRPHEPVGSRLRGDAVGHDRR
jgi:serine/threonine protein kinase